ncbi:GNAT family acetyltransferase [Paenibacillus selenitireducens]|uniref:GNAT family acetyltransferase n=1 Tax=Paenibacillus selenitireducens TaxID=1324314 RepID=A0A1T2X1T1_9BACL|nr:GNAT family acetyltransferase [Paenibacillus selenitireducens]OPA73829.1 GNAT family acetyltransferase [Paenibacillus selenitireducens]
MEYIRITSIEDPLFTQMHQLMQSIFPPEEVLAFDLWREPLQDPDIRVFVAVHEGQVVGATEYRYVQPLNVAMTDFTIIGQPGLGIGRFLYKHRERDLDQLASEAGQDILGMFAEIYNPYLVGELEFGGVAPMNPIVRREVLSHIGYQRLDFPYVHPSWGNDGEAVDGLDFSFMPKDEELTELSGQLIVDFLTWYYRVLPNKPQAWLDMINTLQHTPTVALRPL